LAKAQLLRHPHSLGAKAVIDVSDQHLLILWMALSMGLVLAVIGHFSRKLVWTGLGLATLIAAFTLQGFPALAQQDSGELGKVARNLVDLAEARSKSLEGSLKDWTDQLKDRSQTYQAEAASLAAANRQQLKRGMTMLKDDPFFGDAAALEETDQPSEGVVYVAVSLTMPRAALRQLAADANRAGAMVVVRGFVEGSPAKTMAAARQIFDEDSAGGLAIDPQVFRAYGVQTVPTFIVATSPVTPCQEGLDCTSDATPNDQVRGNISLAAALKLLAEQGQAAPHVASRALKRLGG
jgi:conjugal transfer pilus assembly protein TrbC